MGAERGESSAAVAGATDCVRRHNMLQVNVAVGRVCMYQALLSFPVVTALTLVSLNYRIILPLPLLHCTQLYSKAARTKDISPVCTYYGEEERGGSRNPFELSGRESS